MTRDEFNALLIRLQVLDNRQVDRMTAEVWWPIIGTLPYSDAIEALNEHFRESPEVYLKPGHIVQGVRRIRANRAPHYDHSKDIRGDAPRPQNLKAMSDAWDDPDAWGAEVRAYNDQLRASEMPHYVLDPASSERHRSALASLHPNEDAREIATSEPYAAIDFTEPRHPSEGPYA